MRHNFHIEGLVSRLRPITIKDAESVIILRSDKNHTRYIHSISSKVEDQLIWMENYFQREGDYYFAVESTVTNSFEGTISIYDYQNDKAEWGRWVLKPNSLLALESVMLLYKIAFEVMGINELYCRTVDSNRSVLSFHDRCGLIRRHLIPNGCILKDKYADVLEHYLLRENWPATKDILEPQVERIAKILMRTKSGKNST